MRAVGALVFATVTRSSPSGRAHGRRTPARRGTRRPPRPPPPMTMPTIPTTPTMPTMPTPTPPTMPTAATCPRHRLPPPHVAQAAPKAWSIEVGPSLWSRFDRDHDPARPGPAPAQPRVRAARAVPRRRHVGRARRALPAVHRERWLPVRPARGGDHQAGRWGHGRYQRIDLVGPDRGRARSTHRPRRRRGRAGLVRGADRAALQLAPDRRDGRARGRRHDGDRGGSGAPQRYRLPDRRARACACIAACRSSRPATRGSPATRTRPGRSPATCTCAPSAGSRWWRAGASSRPRTRRSPSAGAGRR